MDIVLNFFDGFPAWIHAVTSLMVAATAVTALTKSTSDDKIVGWILKILNIVAGNVLKNRNADDG